MVEHSHNAPAQIDVHDKYTRLPPSLSAQKFKGQFRVLATELEKGEACEQGYDEVNLTSIPISSNVRDCSSKRTILVGAETFIMIPLTAILSGTLTFIVNAGES